MFGVILGWFRRRKKKQAVRPARPPRRRPPLASSDPMYSQMQTYALDLIAATGQHFATRAEREELMHRLVMEIEDAVHEQVYSLLTPDDRLKAEALESEAERRSFLRTRLGDVETRITWAMSEFRRAYLARYFGPTPVSES